ncbi:MAG: MFS transporter [Bacteroidetes bacterium]|nr:MAG: MFS transporter [Bacteroidota bacterium]
MQSGRTLIFIIGGIAVTVLPWQWVFFIPSGIMLFMGFLTYRVVQDSPEDAGHKSFDTQDATSGDTEKVNLKYLFKKVFTNPITITIAAAEFCTGFVRHGFEQWFPRYMQEVQNLSLESAVFQKGALSVVVAGILGAFAAGTISDWVFRSRRTPVAFFGYLLQVGCLYVVWQVQSIDLVIIAFVVNSFAISVVHSMLSGTASMDFGGKKAAASATGMFDGMQYIGGAAVGSGMGWMLETFGWTVWGPSMIGFAVIGAILMMFLWNVVPASSKPKLAIANPTKHNTVQEIV